MKRETPSAASGGLIVTIDTAAAAPTGLHLADDADTLTNDATPAIAGTAEAGQHHRPVRGRPRSRYGHGRLVDRRLEPLAGLAGRGGAYADRDGRRSRRQQLFRIQRAHRDRRYGGAYAPGGALRQQRRADPDLRRGGEPRGRPPSDHGHERPGRRHSPSHPRRRRHGQQHGDADARIRRVARTDRDLQLRSRADRQRPVRRGGQRNGQPRRAGDRQCHPVAPAAAAPAAPGTDDGG